MAVTILRKSKEIPNKIPQDYSKWNPTIKEQVLRLRRNMLIHSYVYYKLDTSLVSDDIWQKWANELVDMQKVYGTKFGHYDEEFEGWDATTGYHLPSDNWVVTKANYLVSICNTK